MSKGVLVYYFNTLWPMYILDYGGKCHLNSFLSYCTIIQLEQYCQQLAKWDKINYVNAFMSLCNRISPETENCLMVQRREEASKPLPDGRT